ncbi:FAD dependent oxidoreductase [Mycena albidolilacea]|uniref:FAD dependent oxidoreductase n=1 Tax=Mycena albidolilacea TaxID=1033008 RepID=A0AAD7APC0_9AGAR|nr:FAD dependent oxidoreductase [Mycena albidolilacea]
MSLPAPGLPHTRPCLSIWQRSTRHNALLNEGRASDLPPTADAIVIGSGISGALTALELLSSPNGPKNVVMLEAREAVSGATGRNAGHCRPDAFRGFSAFSKRINPEQAMKIIVHEKLVLQLLKAFIKKHNIDCDFDYCRTFDVVMGKEFLDYVTGSFEAYKQAGGDTSDITCLNILAGYSRSTCTRGLRMDSRQFAPCQTVPVGSTTCQVARPVAFHPHTPVTSVTSSGNANDEWVVNTPRGSISTPIVVHATNAFAATLIPCLKSQVRPVRAQAHKLIPTAPFTGRNILSHTYSLRFSLSHFYSVIQRKGDGAIVLGTSRGVPGIGQEIFETKDDSVVNKTIQEDCLANFKQVFSDWGDEVLGEGHEFGWTGILGLTKDAVPFIGPVPSLPGQFVIAGFNGHGMARIFGSAPGLAQIILGGKWSDTTMPECFQITTERLERLSALP